MVLSLKTGQISSQTATLCSVDTGMICPIHGHHHHVSSDVDEVAVAIKLLELYHSNTEDSSECDCTRSQALLIQESSSSSCHWPVDSELSADLKATVESALTAAARDGLHFFYQTAEKVRNALEKATAHNWQCVVTCKKAHVGFAIRKAPASFANVSFGKLRVAVFRTSG